MIYLKAIVLAIVEGVTEFLPVSSTGHLILVEEFLNLSGDGDFWNTFTITIQFPAIVSVLVYFWKDLWPYGATGERREQILALWAKVCLALMPAVVLGLFFGDYLEERFYSPVPVAVALLIGGIVLIAVERMARDVSIEDVADITFKIALAIGLFQCIAMIPGTSRSAATIIGAMLLGASRPVAAEFSFFLAIPTMFAATVYSIAKSGLAFKGEQWAVLGIGWVVSFIVAYAVIAALMQYIRQRSFAAFGYYRIALALAVLAAWKVGWIDGSG